MIIRVSVALPVSVSTSATATWVPNGNVAPGWENTVRISSRSFSASCVSGTTASGSPATLNALRGLVEDQVGRARLQLGRGAQPGHVDQLQRRLLHRRAALLQAARAAGAAAFRDEVGVAPLQR